ncbi:thiamine phosphate synthase [Paenibacillus thiaminolyticus]|uniref:thiamine phosphate synthase n=1 Tax=Paenibacillus thiaminolyticus TaxID=49283 RepID=UPI0025438BAF|nr:thiamine phosphate synthase [Paenibacillus thiaminolyticus]WII37186.1 thiamine phosphate synthase [Paenibacillus thiaminolyticus]
MSRVRPEEMRAHLPLYLVMGSVNCRMDPVQVAEEALAGGVSVLQYREKGRGALIGDDKKRLGAELQAVCKRHGVPFIVNDDLELALELGADGIHIGQQDERADRVRSRIGDLMLGVSAHTAEEARLAIEQGADYLGIGPIYPTQSKEDALEAQGPSIIGDIRAAGINMPLVGIGGITLANAGAVLEAGADGIAVISALTGADDIRAAAASFRRLGPEPDQGKRVAGSRRA